MISLIDSMNRLAARWTDVMTSVLWQSTLLAIAAAAVCWALRRQSPRVRYWIWLVLAAKLLLLPMWSVDVPLPQSLEPGGEPASSVATAIETTPSPSIADSTQPPAEPPSIEPVLEPAWFEAITWQAWLFALWAAVVMFEVGRTMRQFIRLRRLLRHARPVDYAIEALVHDCARTLGLRNSPAVRLIDVDGSPLVCGPLRPVLLLPASYADQFDPSSLRQVVLHELAHVRRLDLFTVWIFHAMRTAYWFHPVVHWIAYRAGLERELACDQLAMSHSGATPAAYARTLIHSAGRGSQPMVLTAAGAEQLDGGVQLELGESS
jgi:bla regulator protein blaR1